MSGKPSSCKFCYRTACWAWQPFGPDESPFSFAFLGSHYRGFEVIKICDYHKDKIEWARFHNRPSIFILRVNEWSAIMPNGDRLASPFDIDNMHPVILGND